MRVNELKRRMGDAVEIQWKSFLLRTEPKVSSQEKFVNYTKSWANPAEMEPNAVFTTPWASDDNGPSSSLPAQIVWKASAQFGAEAQEAVHHALLDAYFVKNRDISNEEVLLDIVIECGIDGEAFSDVINEQQLEIGQSIIEEHNDAISRGITAVPTVVLGGAFPVPGAQDVETYERLVERMISRQQPADQADDN